MTRDGTAFLAAALSLLACTGVPLQLVAQEAARAEKCDFLAPSGNLNLFTLSGGATVTYIGTPHIRCQDGIEIWADSVIEYSAQGMQHLIGSVRFIDENGELRADQARYFSELGRLQAEGHVFVQDTVQGFTIRNGNLVYLRVTDFRAESEMRVDIGPDRLRPRAILQIKPPPRVVEATEPEAADTIALDTTAAEPTAADTIVVDTTATHPTVAGATRADSASAEPPAADTVVAEAATERADDVPGPPYLVDGDRIVLRGDSYFHAVGDVEIERDSLHAYADSVEYNEGEGRILLDGSARVEDLSYDLEGRTITIGMDGDDIDELRAVHDAALDGDDLELTAPEIRIYLLDDLLQRVVAVTTPADSGVVSGDRGAARPLAVAEDFELTADSLDVIAPGGVLQRIFAGGAARSVSRARDSVNVEALPEIARTDWLDGDTVIVSFLPVDTDAEPSSASDTARSQYRIDRIVARVGARSLYRLPPSDTTAELGVDAPAVHYVLGDEITIIMSDGEVDRMEVTGQTRGVHLEPIRRPEDSLAADTAAVDTTAVDTTVADTAVDTAVARDTTTLARSWSGADRDARSPARDSRSPTRDGQPLVREPIATLVPWRRT